LVDARQCIQRYPVAVQQHAHKLHFQWLPARRQAGKRVATILAFPSWLSLRMTAFLTVCLLEHFGQCDIDVPRWIEATLYHHYLRNTLQRKSRHLVDANISDV
ncbi:MAG: hypothetical protein ACRERU_06025, partial [Methylococcales bacterium]